MAKTADTIAIYSRKSRYTGKGESIGNQIDLCREYIRTHYGDAAAQQAVVFEDEGFSGGNLNRPDFKKMMTAAKERKFKAIVVYRLDRISRNISDFSSLIEELGRLGLTPALCHPDHTMLFPAERMPKRKKPPGEPLGSTAPLSYTHPATDYLFLQAENDSEPSFPVHIV